MSTSYLFLLPTASPPIKDTARNGPRTPAAKKGLTTERTETLEKITPVCVGRDYGSLSCGPAVFLGLFSVTPVVKSEIDSAGASALSFCTKTTVKSSSGELLFGEEFFHTGH